MSEFSKPTLVEKWTASAKNHPVSAAIIFGALALAGVATTLKHSKEIVALLNPTTESISAELLDPTPMSTGSVQLLVRNAGSETAVIQHVVFNIRVKPEGVLRSGFAVFFPVAGTKAVAGHSSETLHFAPVPQGMFLPSEATNPDFVAFFKSLGKAEGLDPAHFRQRWMEKATCEMSVNVTFASGSRSEIYPNVKCTQLSPIVLTEFADK